MADIQIFQNSVNGGEISPQLEGRVDNARYNTGARLLENFLVKPNGSISKRPGTEYLATLPAQGRLETYRASEETNYMLVFTAGRIRPYGTNGTAETLPVSGMTTAPVAFQPSLSAADTIFYSTIDNKYYISHLSTIADPATAASGYDEYTFTPGQVVFSSVELFDYLGLPSGIFIDTAYKAIDTFNTFHPLSSTEYWFQLQDQLDDITFIEYFDDIWTPYSEDELFQVQTTQINDLLFCVHKNHRPIIVARDGNGDWLSYYADFTFGPGDDYNTTDVTLKLAPFITEWDKNATVWTSGTTVYANEYVKYASNFYLVKVTQESNLIAPPLALSAFELLSYYVNNKVFNDNNVVFTCKTNHTPVTGATSQEGEPGITTGAWTTNWNVGYTNQTYSPWSLLSSYTPGIRVTHIENNYESLSSHSSERLSEPGVGNSWTEYWELIPTSRASSGGDEYFLEASNVMFSASSIGENIQLVINQTNNSGNINIGTMATSSTSATDSLFFQGDYIVSTSWTVGNALSGGSTISILESLDNINFQTIREFVFDANKISNNVSFTGQTPTIGAWYKVIVNKVGVGGLGQLTIEPTINTTTFNCKIVEYINPIKVKIKSKAGNTSILPIKAWNVPTTIYKKSAFSVPNGFPATVAYHEQRLWFAGVPSLPGRIWGSAKNRLYDFRTGVLDTDALDITIASKSTNQISWLQSINRYIVVGTAGEIYTIDSGSNASNITPTSIRSQLRTSMGSSQVPGKVVGDSILYIQTGSNRLREFIYSDGTDSFIAPDLNVMADHIAEDKFIQTAYQSNLDQTLWIVNSKGGLLGYTFDFAEGVGAWHRHFTGSRSDFYGVSSNSFDYEDNVFGKAHMFTSVATLNPEGDSLCDQVWLIAKRWVTNQYKYFLERLDTTNMDFVFGASEGAADRWRFIDSHRTYNTNNPTGSYTIVIGEDTYNYNSFTSHLGDNTYQYILSGSELHIFSHPVAGIDDSPNGKILTAAGNGGIALELSNPLSGSFTVGLPVFSTYQPTRIDVNMGNGGSQGRLMRLNRFALRLWRSYGGSFNVYDPLQMSVTDAVTGFEFKPIEGDVFTAIDYDKFTFNLSNQYPKITQNSYYTGQTSDQHVNGSWSNNPVFTIVHDQPKPFNIIGVVYKAEISSN